MPDSHHVGGVVIPVIEVYFRFELDHKVRLGHDTFRLDIEFRLDHMSRPETLFSVADPASASVSDLLFSTMNEIVAQIDKMPMAVPNNHPPYPLS